MNPPNSDTNPQNNDYTPVQNSFPENPIFAQQGPVMGPSFMNPQANNAWETPVPIVLPPKKSRKRLYTSLAAGLGLVALLTGGAVFGYYIPNKPENVYLTGIERSGAAIEEMVEIATKPELLQEIEKSEIKGTIEATFDKDKHRGSFNFKSDPNKSNGKFEYTYPADGVTKKVAGEIMTQLSESARFPDIFFKITGVKDFVGDYLPDVAAYEGKWIAVESEYVNTLTGFTRDEPKNRENVTATEIASLVRAVSDVTNEYVFSTDPKKAVLENRSFVGKEKTAEGINAYRYKVGLNKTNTKAYCKAYVEKIYSEVGYKKLMNLSDEDAKEQKKSDLENCNRADEEVEQNKTYTMWIDAKYKVIHKVRVYENPEDSTEYADIGQIFTGGNKLALFSVYNDEKEKLAVKLTVDVDIPKANSITKLTAKSEADAGFLGQFDFDASVTAGRYDGEVLFNKPPNTVPIEELLQKFGYDPTGLSGLYSTESFEDISEEPDSSSISEELSR